MSKLRQKLRKINDKFYTDKEIPSLMQQQMKQSAEEGKVSHVFKCKSEEQSKYFHDELINNLAYEGFKLSHLTQDDQFFLVVSWE